MCLAPRYMSGPISTPETRCRYSASLSATPCPAANEAYPSKAPARMALRQSASRFKGATSVVEHAVIDEIRVVTADIQYDGDWPLADVEPIPAMFASERGD